MLDQETNMKQFNRTFMEDDSSASEFDYTQSQSSSSNKEPQYNTGRWSVEEHLKFIDGFLEYGNEWKKVQSLIGTRSSTQARSHAQKFFLRIKKNFNLLDGICSSFSTNQESLNDSVSIKNFLELLTSQEKEKMKLPSEQLSENQKLKILHLVAKLSNTPTTAFAHGRTIQQQQQQQQQLQQQQQHQHQLQPLLQQQSSLQKFNTKQQQQVKHYSNQQQALMKMSKDEMDHEGKSINIEEYDDATITYLNNKEKIFNIKKDKSRRESINSLNYSKSSLKFHKMSVDEQSYHKDGFLHLITTSDLCSTNSISPLHESLKVNNYGEINNFFGRKRKSDSNIEYEDFSRPRFNSTIESKCDGFFAQQMMHFQMNEDYNYSAKSNAFVINFDEFSLNNEHDCLRGNIENDAMKIDFDPFIALNH